MSEETSPYGGRRVSGSYRLDVPRWVLLGILQRHLGPYSREAALISYLLDVDAGTVKSIREYARIWDWTKKKVELELPRIREEIEDWRGETAPGFKEHAKGTVGGQLGDSRGTKEAQTDAETTDRGTVTGQLRDSWGTHTIQPHPQPQKEEPPRPPTGGSKRSTRTVAPTVDEIIAAIELPAVLRTERFTARWLEWVRVRLRMKRPADPVAMFRAQAEMAAEVGEAVAFDAIGESLRNGWQGVFFERQRNGNGHAAHQPGHRSNGRQQSSNEKRLAASQPYDPDTFRENIARVVALGGRDGSAEEPRNPPRGRFG